MNVLTQWLMTRGARHDARAGLQSAQERIVAELGLRPKLDPVGNPEHAVLVSTLANRTRIDELRDDVGQAEDMLGEHASPIVLTVGLVVTVAVEVLGALLIMKALGVHPAERLPLGLALALALVGITAVLAHRTAARAVPGKQGEGGGALPVAHGRSAWTLVVLVAYSLFVAAITIIRIQSSTDEDASQLEIVAQSLLMLATSLGPAWIAEYLMRRRAPSVALRRRLGMLRRRLKDAERAHARAQEAVNRITRDGLRWDADTARRRALYTTHHRLEQAKEKHHVQEETQEPGGNAGR